MTDTMTNRGVENRPRCIIIIPCLNEKDHIGPLLDSLTADMDALDCDVIVADGGSTDGTQAIVEACALDDPRIRLMHNPRRIQSAAINAAVAAFGEDIDYLIRIDAHGGYPQYYCQHLVAEALRTDADSVVVSMLTQGRGLFQRAVAEAQNSRLGTGGSSHRIGASGHWVDHGHHALMRVSAFRSVGGYDETFSHNEDAELDLRLRRAGLRIWMTDQTRMVYFPRAKIGALFSQYLGYGRGRAKNLLKHRNIPRVRQVVPLLVAPAVALAILAPFHWIFALPFLVWSAICLAWGVLSGLRKRQGESYLAGVPAMVMHLAWSAGFWLQLAGIQTRREAVR